MRGITSLLVRLGRWRILGIVLLGGLLVAAGGLSFVSAQEQNNQFCGSCHTQPESTYLMRFEQAQSGDAVDLAAFHHKQLYPRDSQGTAIKCIDCHVGEGLVGRGIVVSLATWDAIKYVTGTAQQPARIVFTVQDEACIKCHEAQVKEGLATAEQRFFIDNHFHYLLFTPGAPKENCVSCHVSHRPGSEVTAFQFRTIIIPVCQDCHQKEGKGPTKMQ
ncbi:MAG: hypothetical protein WCF84_15320 [Anaerolineae bacterium]